MLEKNAKNKTWYKVPCGCGYTAYSSIEELFDRRKAIGEFSPIKKIIEVVESENQLDDSVVDELNNKLKEYYAEKSNA